MKQGIPKGTAMIKRDNSISAWADDNGEFIMIGNELCDEGDTVLSIPANEASVVEWIKVLLRLLDDGELCDLPGEIIKCTGVKEA